MSSSWHHILVSPPLYIEIYRVGDNRSTVNTSTTLHISDQLGTENASPPPLRLRNTQWHENKGAGETV